MKVEGVKAEVAANYEKIEPNKNVVNENATAKIENKVNTDDKNDKNERKDIESAVTKINHHLEVSNTRIKFKIHDSEFSLNNKVSIKVIDEDSEKVIAEIPSEEAIELSERMDQIIGFLFDECK